MTEVQPDASAAPRRQQVATRYALGPLAAYGALRGPLALLELPLFVLLPSFYAAHGGIGIAAIGAILLVTRVADALVDPLIGAAMDRGRGGAELRRWIYVALPFLTLGFIALFEPPGGSAAGWWLAICAIVVHTAYSVVSIAYQAWGAALGSTPRDRVRVTATREAFGLAGVIVSAAFMGDAGPGGLSAAFTLAVLLAVIALRRAPLAPPSPVAADRSSRPRPWRAMRRALDDRDFRWLLAAFASSGIATAIPATLVLFYVADVLGARDHAPWLLLLYFACAALAMPAWPPLAARFGLRNAWLAGIGLSVVGFVWALGLVRGDTTAFAIICAITGFALAADLAIPPAMLAALTERANPLPRATSFGIWHLVTKLNLALAAGIGLPLLAFLGYVPSASGGVVDAALAATPGAPGAAAPGTVALALVYAGLPCLLKIAAAFILLLAPQPAVRGASA
ncbi:MAG: MFS transporter [Lautropia sp.]